MKNISEKDVIAFGHVLEAIGKVIASKPDIIMNLLETSINNTLQQDTDSNLEEIDSEKVEKYPLYDLAKSLEETDLVAELMKFNLLELKLLIKTFRLGSSKYKSKERIVAYIAEQAKKRSIDVFREHNLDSSGDEKIVSNEEEKGNEYKDGLEGSYLGKGEWSNGIYYITIRIKNGKGEGEIVNKQTYKTWSLEKAISDDRESSTFPQDVSQNLHRLMDEMGISEYTFNVRR